MPIPYHEVSLHSPPTSLTTNTTTTNTTTNKWGPYANASDFSANMVITLIVLFCGLFLALAINAAIRFVLCARRRRTRQPDDPEKQAAGGKTTSSPSDALPTLIFSQGTQLSGAEAECAICLADFVEGDGVRVMPACNHGFHVQCVERWLAAKRSCPTCRATYPAPVPAGEGL